MNERYVNRKMSALDAQRVAHEIAFAPVVFQVSRLMVRFGIFNSLMDTDEGYTAAQIAQKVSISEYAAKVLLESSLTAGTVLFNEGKFRISKIGWFLQNDPMVKANMDFCNDVNYKGMFHLEEALKEGRPAGLKELGDWPTIYEGLSQLPEDVSKSWFGFDHYYSDNSFDQALPLVFKSNPLSLLDVGGNTGKWALKCVEYSSEVNVTVMDLPQQIGLMRNNIAGKPGADRIGGHPGNLLDETTAIPTGFDVVWMSQFLDCFSEEQVVSILKRTAASLKPRASIFILETLWDRQRYDAASFDLAQTSVYFSAMANGNSKMFYSEDLERMIDAAGLNTVSITDDLGLGHSLIQCVKL